MKQFSKRISKYLLLVSIFVTLSCEVQENLNENNQRKILIEDFSLRSIQGKTSSKLLETANKIKNLNATAANSRIVYNADFDFFMEDEHGKHVVIDGQDSYTFEITRATGDQKVENIVFNEKTDGSFDTYIIKYDFTKGEFSSLPTSVLKDKETTYSVLDTQTNRSDPICIVTEVWVSGQSQWGPNEGGGGVPGFWANFGVECPSFGSSQITPAYSGGNPNGGNGNPGGAPRPMGGIPSTPVVIPPANPCVKLAAKTNDPLFKSKVDLLNSPSNFSAAHETGFSEGKDPVTGVTSYTNQVGTGSSSTLPFLPNTTGQVHVHNHNFVILDANGDPKVYVPVPGYGDLIAFITSYQTHAVLQGLSSQDTYQLTIQPESEGSFAFMSLVDNLDVNDGSIDFEKVKVNFIKLSEKLIEENNLNNTSARKMLLNLMKDNGLSDKVGLYLATNPEKTQWSRIMLNSLGSIVTTPCN